jgi:trehalose 6-phosphate phosphatase
MDDALPLPRKGERWALFLDVDGTLVEIATTPRAVCVEPDLLARLERLQRGCEGALALISGRRLADIDDLFQPLVLPAAGLHGWERRREDGTLVEMGEPSEIIAPLRVTLAAYAASRPDILLEDKGSSLALHYRLAPRYGGAVTQLARRLAAADPRLRLIEGRKVVEFQPRGTDKGRAVIAFLSEPPFVGRRPIYAGDDVTDEDGFIAVNRTDGFSIKVKARESRQGPPSAAQYQVPSVAELHRWLDSVADRLSRWEGTAVFDRVLS